MYCYGHIKASCRSSVGVPAFASSVLTLNSLGRQSISPKKETCMTTTVGNRKGNTVIVALTRELGKNVKLRQATAKALTDVCTVELPCVKTTVTKERARLPKLLLELFDWILITSPESASVFVDSWQKFGAPQLGRIAAIGGGTAEVLENAGLSIAFQPSKAVFRFLAAELPEPAQNGARILYPASAKASDNNVQALENRGFNVLRINTYSTETVRWSDVERAMYEFVDVATFASPTTVKGWMKNVSQERDLPVACIGETSAAAAKAAGFTKVFYPKSPGLAGWVEAIREASSCKSNV